MENRAYGGLSLLFVTASFLLISLGILWLFNGIGDENGKLILKGAVSLIFGFGLGAVANFLKF